MTGTSYAALAIELSHDCVCGALVALNAVSPRFACAHCGRLVEIQTHTWASLLSYALSLGANMSLEEQHDSLFNAPSGVVRRSVRRVTPTCPTCNAPVDMNELAAVQVPGWLYCGQCGHRVSVRRLPEISPQTQWFVGEDAELLDPQHLAGRESVVVPCGECGAPLPVDGTARSVHCEHCGTTSVVPDEVWARVHPSHGVKRFYAFVATAAGSAPGVSLNQVHAVVGDEAGNLYFADHHEVFSVDASLRLRWRRHGVRCDAITIVSGRLIAYYGRLCTALTLDRGEDAAPFAPQTAFERLVGAADGTAFAVHRNPKYSLMRFDATGNEIALFPRRTTRSFEYRKPPIAAHPRGGLVLLDLVEGQDAMGEDVYSSVCRFLDASGRETSSLAVQGDEDDLGTALLAVDRRGRAFAAYRNVVFVFDPGARELCRVGEAVRALVPAPGGELWVFSEDGIRRLGADGSIVYADERASEFDAHVRLGARQYPSVDVKPVKGTWSSARNWRAASFLLWFAPGIVIGGVIWATTAHETSVSSAPTPTAPTAPKETYRQRRYREKAEAMPPPTTLPRVLLQDDFSNPKSGFAWKSRRTNFAYEGGALHVTTQKLSAYSTVPLKHEVVTVDVDVSFARSSSPVEVGVICRRTKEHMDNLYTTVHKSWIYHTARHGKSRTSAYGDFFESLEPDGGPPITTLHLHAECLEKALRLYVNGKPRVQTEWTAERGDYVGVWAREASTGANVRFDNFVVRGR